MRTLRELRRTQDSARLMSIAIMFTQHGRSVPAHILRQLWGLRGEWKKRKDVPAQVIEACRILDAMPKREDL